MLIRNRLSRIFYLRKFFDYPVTLNINTIKNLGLVRLARIGFSYIKARIFQIRHERSLEDFFINRFGRELYLTFFKDYTEKVWGLPCDQLGKDWGSQRIKGLSLMKTVFHAVKSLFISRKKSIDQKNVETSLIEQFMYPKFGPGQLWEEVAAKIIKMGGEIHTGRQVKGIKNIGRTISEVSVAAGKSKTLKSFKADYFFSTMPVKDLVNAFEDIPSVNIVRTANDLRYRDFITVGLLLNKLKIKNGTDIKTVNNIVPDNWIYIQERDVRVGRLQLFNNWSPYLVKDPDKVWLGLEYFCQEGDEYWKMPDKKFTEFAVSELEKIDIIDKKDVVDSVVIRVPKTYPAYFGGYERFEIIRDFLDGFGNLFLIGRNGMHRYNNMDHSMLTAMTAVENIINGVKTKDNLWAVNTEEEYHEEKK
jgi:protoporphyrinogen oxidase